MVSGSSRDGNIVVAWHGRLDDEEGQVSDRVSRGEQAADEVARRWMATMQSMGDQLLRQQQAFQQMMQEQMSSYAQLLNTPPFYVSQQPHQEGQKATGQAFQQASEQWMELARKQQQAFQQVVQQSLSAYTDLFKPPSR